MTALEKMQNFIKMYPGYDQLEQFNIDYTDAVPNAGGIMPGGLVELETKTDIFGNRTVHNQLNFAIYCRFAKDPGDDVSAGVNAEWVADFQQWVQEQSAMGNAPEFGDEPWAERITAQNGMIFEADEEGTAIYMVQIAVTYRKHYERT